MTTTSLWRCCSCRWIDWNFQHQRKFHSIISQHIPSYPMISPCRAWSATGWCQSCWRFGFSGTVWRWTCGWGGVGPWFSRSSQTLMGLREDLGPRGNHGFKAQILGVSCRFSRKPIGGKHGGVGLHPFTLNGKPHNGPSPSRVGMFHKSTTKKALSNRLGEACCGCRGYRSPRD
jgi:hypothetical protein